jgi:chromosome segregation ATPase
VEHQIQEIKELREKVEIQSQDISGLEKERIELSMDNDRKDSSIVTLETTVKDLKERLLNDSSSLQQLKLDHVKLDQKSVGLQNTIEQLHREIQQITDRLSQ